MGKSQKSRLWLKSKDKTIIRGILKEKKESLRVLQRAKVLAFLQKGKPVDVIAEYLSLAKQSVYNIRDYYIRFGLKRTLEEDPRPGRPRIFNTKQFQKIIAMVCSDPPEGRARWTIRLITHQAVQNSLVPQISRETVRILLKSHDLKPWRQKMWCIPELNDEYIERMEDVLNLYERPYNSKHPVVCIDEKSIQVLSDTREGVLAKPGKPARIDHEYKREGTANAFVWIEPLAGKYNVTITKHRKKKDFAKIIYKIERIYQEAKSIHLVLDNLNTHNIKSLVEQYGEEKAKRIWKRFDIHYTPKHGSWLNQGEIGIALYSSQCLGKRRMGNIERLINETKVWVKQANRNKVRINWTFRIKDAKEKFDY